jgi:hypothetical protein
MSPPAKGPAAIADAYARYPKAVETRRRELMDKWAVLGFEMVTEIMSGRGP